MYSASSIGGVDIFTLVNVCDGEAIRKYDKLKQLRLTLLNLDPWYYTNRLLFCSTGFVGSDKFSLPRFKIISSYQNYRDISPKSKFFLFV